MSTPLTTATLGMLLIGQPFWLAAALVAAAFVAILIHVRPWRPRRVGVAVAIGFGVAAMAGLLAWLDAAVSHWVLGVGACAAGAWLTTLLLRRSIYGGSVTTRTAIGVLRFGAWMTLLVLLARPSCTRVETRWEKPLVAVVLDQSLSMDIVDQVSTEGRRTGPARAARVNEHLEASRARLAEIELLNDVRIVPIGEASRPAGWHIEPRAPVTGLAAALRAAREMRSVRGAPAAAVVVISDGAENLEGGADVQRVAADLAGQGSPVLVVGVGPETGLAPMVELSPLVVPPRVGSHDRVHVAVQARAYGLAKQSLTLDIIWGDTTAASMTLKADGDVQYMEPTFELPVPGPGAHRLTARVTLPEALGGDRVSVSAIVEVSDERVRVLWLEGVPRSESAFGVRAIRGDGAFEVTPLHLMDEDSAARLDDTAWRGYDVVILGQVPRGTPRQALNALAEEVTQQGVGLLLAGGSSFFYGSTYAASRLVDLCPAEIADPREATTDDVRLNIAPGARAHPVLAGLDDRREAVGGGAAWSELPPIGRVAGFAKAGPAAEVLLTHADARPVLVAQDVGRGRVLAAAWETTWPIALASDDGSALHARLWRQMVAWLANRRPQAWVVTDRDAYAHAAVRSGAQRVMIRAGLTGVAQASAALGSAKLKAGLRIRRAINVEAGDTDAAWAEVSLGSHDADWRAEFPRAWPAGLDLAPGDYELEFTFAAPPSSSPVADAETGWTARSRFTIFAEDLEHRVPTANLRLLASLAERTRDVGGRYFECDELPQLLTSLTRTDRRQRVEHQIRQDVLAHVPWVLLTMLVVLAGVEWAVRKRINLP